MVTASCSSAQPTTTSFPFGSCCRRRATSSSTALHSLSTRACFFGLLNSQSLIRLSLTTSGAGGATTLAVQVALPLSPCTSVTSIFTLSGPGGTLVVSRVAVLVNSPGCAPAVVSPCLIVPALVRKFRLWILAWSGLLPSTLRVIGSPGWTLVGVAEHAT